MLPELLPSDEGVQELDDLVPAHRGIGLATFVYWLDAEELTCGPVFGVEASDWVPCRVAGSKRQPCAAWIALWVTMLGRRSRCLRRMAARLAGTSWVRVCLRARRRATAYSLTPGRGPPSGSGAQQLVSRRRGWRPATGSLSADVGAGDGGVEATGGRGSQTHLAGCGHGPDGPLGTWEAVSRFIERKASRAKSLSMRLCGAGCRYLPEGSCRRWAGGRSHGDAVDQQRVLQHARSGAGAAGRFSGPADQAQH
jgi:hypothetical protein